MAWHPRLLNASPERRANREIAGGGYGIHWPDVDEDLSPEGIFRGTPAPRQPTRAWSPPRLVARNLVGLTPTAFIPAPRRCRNVRFVP
jgi:hypothetical protein